MVGMARSVSSTLSVPFSIALVSPRRIISCAWMCVSCFSIVFRNVLIMCFLSFLLFGLLHEDTWSLVSVSVHEGHFGECCLSCWWSLAFVGRILLMSFVILVLSLSSSLDSALLLTSHHIVAYVDGLNFSFRVMCVLYLIAPYAFRSVSFLPCLLLAIRCGITLLSLLAFGCTLLCACVL